MGKNIPQSDELYPRVIAGGGKCFFIDLPHPRQVLADPLQSHQDSVLHHLTSKKRFFVRRLILHNVRQRKRINSI